MAKAQKRLGFEGQLEQLEAVIAALEKGDMPLDKSIEAYRSGVELVRSLRGELEGAREQLRVLDGDGDAQDERA
ncbi:MAG: exodeoxyribonuclease VII small subunit [Candidatus Fimadaptatus sp.]|jgi:exodeoxyribonuclease VII small subunit